jgi:hypothetical protein
VVQNVSRDAESLFSCRSRRAPHRSCAIVNDPARGWRTRVRPCPTRARRRCAGKCAVSAHAGEARDRGGAPRSGVTRYLTLSPRQKTTARAALKRLFWTTISRHKSTSSTLLCAKNSINLLFRRISILQYASQNCKRSLFRGS